MKFPEVSLKFGHEKRVVLLLLIDKLDFAFLDMDTPFTEKKKKWRSVRFQKFVIFLSHQKVLKKNYDIMINIIKNQ